jgi:hypothetical protein
MAHPDMDDLLSYCIPAAQDLLTNNGEFYPIAATKGKDGLLTPRAIYSGNEHPKSSEMIDEFVALFRNEGLREGLEAVAICYDGRVSVDGQTKKDAITIFLEHNNGECVTVYVPYSKKVFRGYSYEAIIASAAEPRVFTGSVKENTDD